MKNRIVKGMITFVLAACLFTSSIPALAEEISVPVEAEVVDEEPSSAENMPVVKQETEEVAAEENVGEESEVATEIVVLEVEEDETVAEALNNDIVAEGIVAQLEAELSVASEELEQATELMLLAEDTGENEAQKILVPETDYIEMSQQTTGTAVFKIANKYVNNATIKTMTDSTTVMAWCMKVVGGNAKVEDVFYFEHSYVDGICEVCGDTQPDYVVPNADPQIGEKQIGIRVPEGFAVEFGYQQSYKHNYIGEVKVQNNVWVFDAASSKIYFYRVYSVESNNDAVTYWGWLTSAEYKNVLGTIISVTEDMLSLNNERNADTVDEYLTNNIYDTQDILITGNADGYVNLAVGETWTLNCYRMWEIVESFMNANISQPDFHIEVIGVDGQITDCIEIVKNSGDGSMNTVTAVKEGQAILKITYDAVTVDSAMGGSQFSAIAPENTALFVITVGDNKQVNDGIDLDSEADVQYYTGENGAVVIATPDEGSTVEVARCIYDDNGDLQITRFSDTGVEANEDGTVSIIGIMEGSSVIRVTDSEGNVAYQVVKAKSINLFVTDLEGNVINTDEHEFVPGEQFKIVADKFYDVFMKSSGVYNGSAYLTMTLSCKDAEGNDITQSFSSEENIKNMYSIQYDQAKNPVYRTVAVTIPENWDGESSISIDIDINRNTRFGKKLTEHRYYYVNGGQEKVNGYVSQITTATSTQDTLEISDFSEFIKDPNITPANELIGTEILTGDVTAYDNAKVEYKNKEGR